MPYRMHSDYLRQLFLDNDLAEGRYTRRRPARRLTDIRAPVFAVATETDHVAPWRSVYKLYLLLDTDVTFLLTSGGHNAGIVSPLANNGRHYRVRSKSERRHVSRSRTAGCARRRPRRALGGRFGRAGWRIGQAHLFPLYRSGGTSASSAPLTEAPGTYVLAAVTPQELR